MKKLQHAVDADYHDYYDGERPYEECWKECFCERYTTDLIRAIWSWSPPYKLLDSGSANGLTLAAFDSIGVEAWGVENSAYIHRRTPKEWRHRNLLGDVRKLPFEDRSFDFVYDTCLAHLPPEDLNQAVSELYRVCRIGVFYGGHAADMTGKVVESFDVDDNIRSLFSLERWSEIFLRNGFKIATSYRRRLARAWKIEQDANASQISPWYADAMSMRFCFYSRTDSIRTMNSKKMHRA